MNSTPPRVLPLHGISRHETAAGTVDADALAANLRAAVAGEVRFDAGSRALYATDASNYRQLPLGVVVPRDAGDVALAMDLARRHGAAVLGRGGGTSLAGQTCNEGLVFDFSKYMDRILELDARAATARVEPGVVLDALRRACAPHGLTFGPDPATHQYCTLGGMIGNNSCGVRSVMAEFHGPGPTTAHNVEALEVVTYDGTRMRTGATDEHELRRILERGGQMAAVYRRLHAFEQKYAELIRREFPDIPRRVSGYNLPALLPENGFHVARALVGSESTLALVLEATVRLMPALPHRALVVLGYSDVFTAADHVPHVRSHRPAGIEGVDQGLVDDLEALGLPPDQLALLPDGHGWLLVEFAGSTAEEAQAQARDFAEEMRRSSDPPAIRMYASPEDQQKLWEIRESGLAATARVAGRNPTWPGWEDSAVAPERLGAYLRDLDQLFRAHGYRADLYGHFGQGCVHCRVDFELRTAAGIAQFRSFMEAAADLVHRHGGSLSGEHGDGQARGELLSRMFSREMIQAFREFKAIWDPDGRMNPGKIIDANAMDANLRLGTNAEIREGIPIVGLEPSCVSVFRDELVNLFPTSEQAHRLNAQTFTLAEFLDRHPDRVAPFRLERRALVHGHCHHKAVMGTDADCRVLDRLGVRYDMLDAGCCGMAGAFGFEEGHYDVSMAVGERVLLPAVRAASRDTLIVADGFSCREQIAQATDRRALHLAEALHMAMQDGARGPAGDLPERTRVLDYSDTRLTTRELAAAAFMAAGVALAVAGARAAFRRRPRPARYSSTQPTGARK